MPRDELTANTWNPNHVAPTELDLLATSLVESGWTQPIVARPVDGQDGLEIVDGYHRWTLSGSRDDVAALTTGGPPPKTNREARLEAALLDVLDSLDADVPDVPGAAAAGRKVLADLDAEDATLAEKTLVPVVPLVSADLATLMMATIRHNRARGAHHVLRMADIVADLAAEGISPDDICRRLGMEKIEVERLLQRGKMSERGAVDTMSRAWHTEAKDDR